LEETIDISVIANRLLAKINSTTTKISRTEEDDIRGWGTGTKPS
jgi:hypothetical protein